MTVTFVLLAHNQEYSALVSLGSLLSQSNPNWLAIVLNNGKNDPLRELVKKFGNNNIQYNESAEFKPTDTFNREMAFHLSATDFTVCASIDDYFLPNTVNDILSVCEGKDLVYWNGYNHHWTQNLVMNTELKCRGIDWCNFAIKTTFARKINVQHYAIMADGLFIEECMTHNPVVAKIEKMLVVHT